jgi:hypothetical protein
MRIRPIVIGLVAGLILPLAGANAQTIFDTGLNPVGAGVDLQRGVAHTAENFWRDDHCDKDHDRDQGDKDHDRDQGDKDHDRDQGDKDHKTDKTDKTDKDDHCQHHCDDGDHDDRGNKDHGDHDCEKSRSKPH